MKRRIASTLLAAAVCGAALAGPAALAAEEQIGVSINGLPVAFTDAVPYAEHERTMVPLRAVGESLGLKVEWLGEEQTAVFTQPGSGRTVSFRLGSDEMHVGGITVEMDVALAAKDGHVYAPIRYLAEAVGYAAGWDSETNTVLITGGPVMDLTAIDYANINFDFAKEIAAGKEAVALTPDAADIAIQAADAKGATGVMLVAAQEEGNTSDYYLNALVAGNELVFTSAKDGKIASASSSVAGDLKVTDGSFTVIPATIKAAEPEDEVIAVTMEDGTVYKVHTVNELLPAMTITGSGVADANAGVYTFAVDKFLLRVSTAGELVYYRNVNSVGELMAENFQKQNATGEYSYFAELRAEYRNVNGGYSSGMYVVMDENYVETDYLTLLPNTDPNHTHGEGYLDQHEFVIIGDDHYLLLSYTPELVSNLPEGVYGINAGASAYVWAGIFQEVKDGKVVRELSTTDYPFLYASAVEKIDYAGSTDQGTEVEVNGQKLPSLADGWQDYVHPNSLDYTLNSDGTVDKLLVSMRDQSAVYQFDMATGAVDWILGGKASTLTGYEAYTTRRADDNGMAFQALTFGQHYARYTNRDADGKLTGDPVITIFDNQTGMGPFITAVPVPTLTRTFRAAIDEDAKTAAISDVVNGVDLNAKTDKYHIASHCGSVDYFNEHSVVIGWGLHGVIDNIGAMAPAGTITDKGYDDLRAGSRPIFSEYDMSSGEVTFELSTTRNPGISSHEAMFSYRTYKTAD